MGSGGPARTRIFDQGIISSLSREWRLNLSTENTGIDVEVCNGKQRSGNLWLYLITGGRKEERVIRRGIARAMRATGIHPTDASASTALAGEVERARQL
jgi:hypothetical protein